MPAERLSKRAHVMRAGAAAYPEIAYIERMGGLGEIGNLEAVAGERVERHRERMIARNAAAVPIAERLKGRLARRRSVRHRQRRDMAFHGFADAPEQRQHSAGSAAAVEPYHLGAAVLESAAGIDRIPALTGDALVVYRERHHSGHICSLYGRKPDQRFATMRVSLADDEVDTSIHRPL